jgi:hypothetical protein
VNACLNDGDSLRVNLICLRSNSKRPAPLVMYKQVQTKGCSTENRSPKIPSLQHLMPLSSIESNHQGTSRTLPKQVRGSERDVFVAGITVVLMNFTGEIDEIAHMHV